MILPDPYIPALANFAFSAAEAKAITAALKQPKPWDWKPGGALQTTLTGVKGKLRDLHMERHESCCCYCRWSMQGGGHFVVDREHVLPKSRKAYLPLAYTIWNLTVACKRCNMQYKRAKDDFVIDKVNPAAFQDSANYLLIHPNFDFYEDHIELLQVTKLGLKVAIYFVNPESAKGAYTHEYFNLKEREVGNLDKAQGRKLMEDLGRFALEVQEKARDAGQ